jgi:predicted pyridoxine 5'-phosphate oxidase superfamily flavin-nucleotide-binding protein
MDSTAAALRVERFLETEPVIWLSSIRPDGAPHLVPTWFAWDGRGDRHPLEAACEEGAQPHP